jgi:predicted ATP-binding protein involved in virulence
MEDVFHRLTGSTFKVQDIISKSNSNYEFYVSTEGSERIEIQKVSQGTFSVMATVGIIYNYIRARYPDIDEKDILRQHAIVFIDEIDAHLHPDWQRKLINILRESFPMVQFFITAHSPLIVAGCRTEEVAVLRKNGKGFKLEYFAHDFVGFSPEELYRMIFQVEAYDDTYLKYKALVPYKTDIEEEIVLLREKKALSGEDGRRLAKLYDDLYYINIVEEKNMTHRDIESLVKETRKQKAEIEKLKSSKNATE